MKRRAVSLLRLRRSFIFQPMAAILVVLLLPLLSRFEGAGVRISEASAQTLSNAIIQNCFTTVCSDVRQLETGGVNAYLALHSLPANDTSVIYKYGRSDLRSGVRGAMFNILLGIILKPASQRTRHEQNLYNWLQGAVQQNEIADYSLALNQFNSWQSDPCHFTLDADLASQYEISYSGTPFCYGGGSLSGLFAKPPVPAESYFTAYGLKYSYGKSALTDPDFPSIVADTSANVAQVWRIGGGIAAAAGLATGTAVVLVTVLTGVTVNVQLGVTASTAALGALPSALALAAGPLAIVTIAILIGVAAGMQAFNNQQTINNLNNLNRLLDQAKATPPDLNAFASDSSGLGMYKLQSSFVAQTVPEIASTATLPAHRVSDLNFAIQKSTAMSPTISSTLDYEDWNGIDWSAQTYGGWFVQNCNSGENCPQQDSIIAGIRFVDWSGTNWAASRIGNKFIIIKEKPASTDKECGPDPATGVSPGPDFSRCSDYLSASIPLKDPNGLAETVFLSVLAPPVFTGSATLPFTPGVASSQLIATTGNPTPQICFSKSIPPLPSDFTLNGVPLSASACAQGSFKLSFNGNAASPAQNYQLTLAASNGSATNPALGQFTLDVSPHLGITSPATLTGTAGFPINFLVTTTGSPAPKLSIDPGVLVDGLDFKDNGNGTASISGITAGSVNHRCLTFNGGPCGIRASNSQGTVVQAFGIDLTAAPRASLNPPTSATFIVNAPNSVTLTSSGASTPVTWQLGKAPSWLRLANNGDGTANLHGTPPPNTTGTIPADVAPIAFGSGPFVTFTAYPIDVLNVPVFLSSDTAAFTSKSHGSFTARANQGSIALLGTLPPGLSFSPAGTLDCLSPNHPSAACIHGAPAAGTGGQYDLILTDDAGGAGSTSQSLTVNVNESPEITSSNMATFITQTPSSFAITTSGFPNTSSQPVPANYPAPSNPDEGKGMYFTVRGLPADLQFSNLNQAGFATGTLTIQGTPSAGDAGVRAVQITAQNGVGTTARQTILLNILPFTASAPASGTACNGNYSGTYFGDVLVSSGQNCKFVGGGITGSVTVTGGSLALFGATINHDVAIQGSSAFVIEGGTTINGNLFIQNIASGASRNEICGAVVAGDLNLDGNATPLQIGSFSAACPGNSFGGSVVVTNNMAAMGIYNNVIGDTLSCSNDISFIGQGNSAAAKLGQCASF
jgi:hypothetical protein